MLDELFTRVLVAIDTDRCVNTRHDGAGCSRCVDACPTDAIRLRGHLPTLADDLCVRCGACVPTCPTDAITDSDLPERRLLEACERLSTSAVALSCALTPHPRPATPTDTVVRHGRCLAALTTDQLLTLTRDGTRTVTLDLSWCDRCGIGTAGDAAIATADTAAALLDVVGAPAAIAVTGVPDTEGPGAPAEAESGVLDSQRAPITRRGVFATLRSRARIATERAAASPPPPMRRTSGPVPTRLPQSLPPSRRRLLDHLAALHDRYGTAGSDRRAVTSASARFSPITVDADACSGCGLCARYCPTGALSFTTSPPDARVADHFILAFRLDHCIDCGICTVACPDDAVHSGTTIDRDTLTQRRWTPVASGPLVGCSSCGLPTAPVGPTPPRCFSCRLGAGVVTALRDDAGLMADLLDRAPPTTGD